MSLEIIRFSLNLRIFDAKFSIFDLTEYSDTSQINRTVHVKYIHIQRCETCYYKSDQKPHSILFIFIPKSGLIRISSLVQSFITHFIFFTYVSCLKLQFLKILEFLHKDEIFRNFAHVNLIQIIFTRNFSIFDFFFEN